MHDPWRYAPNTQETLPIGAIGRGVNQPKIFTAIGDLVGAAADSLALGRITPSCSALQAALYPELVAQSLPRFRSADGFTLNDGSHSETMGLRARFPAIELHGEDLTRPAFVATVE